MSARRSTPAVTYEARMAEALVSTFAQSEPWRQVWLRPEGDFVVRALLT